jgi:hypothetical protein
MEELEICTPLVVPPLDEPAAYRPLQSVDLGFLSWVPGDLTPPPKPVLLAYFILNASRYQRPWLFTRATFGSGYRQSHMNGAGDVVNAHVVSHFILQIQVERNFIFQISLEFGPINTPGFSTIRWLVEG